MLYEGVKRKIEEHLVRQCSDHLVPAFPPGGLSNLPPEIVLPQSDYKPQQNGTSAAASSSKDKGKAPASSNGSTSVDDASIVGLEGSSNGVAGVGDTTDAAVRNQYTERLLKAMKQVWDAHCASMSSLRAVLTYVDRVYVAQHPVLSIWDLGLELFRDTVIQSQKFPISNHLYAALLTQIQLERKGQVINRSVVKANIDMLVSLTHAQPGRASTSLASRPTVYKHTFEPAFLRTSSLFYKLEAKRLLETTDAKAYLRHVERRFIEEEGRVAVFLAPTTDAPLRSRMESFLLEAHLQTIVNMPGSGMHSMLEEGLTEDLRRLYKLFWRVQPSGPLELKAGLKAFIAKTGKAINEGVGAGASSAGAAENGDGEEGNEQGKAGAQSVTAATPAAASALKWVEDVLAFKGKFDEILAVSFDDDKSIETVLNEAFESFINVNQRAAEFISLFIDENLKKGLKGKTEEEVEEVLNRTIVVFRFLHEKDLFERHYKGHLAKRLLHGRSVSDDAERGMMAKLKIECGHGYVQKLQGMLNDVKVSEETGAAFTEYIKKASRPMPFDLSVSVLTSTYWPIAAVQQACIMPPSMVSARQAFEKFYQSRHSGRLLSWHPNLGSADVRVAFKNRKHELNVSTYALVILLLFDEEGTNASSGLSYAAIKQNTNIPDGDLKRNLQSLACAKYKILLKEPKGRDVGDQDTFTFNEGFSCPLARIKIATVAARVESTTERKETNEKIEEERKNQIEACIVRVMKDRKRLSHNELVNEVIKQLLGRFGPNPLVVKKRIESLIDREYLERDGEQRNVYNYLA